MLCSKLIAFWNLNPAAACMHATSRKLFSVFSLKCLSFSEYGTPCVKWRIYWITALVLDLFVFEEKIQVWAFLMEVLILGLKKIILWFEVKSRTIPVFSQCTNLMCSCASRRSTDHLVSTESSLVVNLRRACRSHSFEFLQACLMIIIRFQSSLGFAYKQANMHAFLIMGFLLLPCTCCRSVSPYMIHLVNALTNKGYERGRTLFGAPYDFRYAPGPHASAVARNYLTDLKGLIEQAYTANDNQPVVLLSHSMGALWSLYFLNNQQMEWRQKFVAHFVTIAAPWGGTVEQMMTFASGNSVGVPFVDPLVVRKEQRSSESNLWLLPVSWVFGKHRPLVISSSGRSYTAADMKEFLHDIITPAGFAATTAAADLHQSCNHLVTAYESRVPHLTEKTSLQAPRVPVTLIYGHGVPTAEMLSYEEKSTSSSKLGFDCVPKIVQGDGDGTVNLCSLTAVIQEWGSTPGQILEVIALSNKSHRNILLDKESIEVIVNVILDTTNTTTTTTTTPQQQDPVLMQSWIWSMLLHIVTLNSVLLNLHLRASMHSWLIKEVWLIKEAPNAG